MPVNYIPKDAHTITPYLVVNGVDRLIAFLKEAFDAELRERLLRPDGAVMHAEVVIGDSEVMLGEPMGDWTPRPGTLYLYVKDVDESFRRALAAGATKLREPNNEFYGDRSGGVVDPSGNQWFIATHIEDVPREEMERRFKEMVAKK